MHGAKMEPSQAFRMQPVKIFVKAFGNGQQFQFRQGLRHERVLDTRPAPLIIGQGAAGRIVHNHQIDDGQISLGII